MNTPAIILAAGASSRMGFPKALLKVGPRTLLEDQIKRLRDAGCSPIIAVVGSEAARIIKGTKARANFVINRRWPLGQFSSVVTGLKKLPSKTGGAIILPVDVALVPPGVTKKLIATSKDTAGLGVEAVVPVHRGRMGHPIWLSANAIKKIIKTDIKTGRLDRMLPEFRLKHVKTTAGEILNNVNTKKDYAHK
jgi:CTP:molybdopterin cytidylyltransferase MocA